MYSNISHVVGDRCRLVWISIFTKSLRIRDHDVHNFRAFTDLLPSNFDKDKELGGKLKCVRLTVQVPIDLSAAFSERASFTRNGLISREDFESKRSVALRMTEGLWWLHRLSPILVFASGQTRRSTFTDGVLGLGASGCFFAQR